MSVVSGQDLAKRLRASRRALMTAAEGAPTARLIARPAEGEWSVIEVLAHLIDVDYHYLGQAMAIRDGTDHLYVGFDDARWKAEHPDDRERSLAEILGSLEKSHTAVLENVVLQTLPLLDREGRHATRGVYTVRDVFERIPVHDENHARQILEILAVV